MSVEAVWRTGNNWGRDSNGTTCLGCGAQEEFYGCADIAIVNSTQRPPPPPRSRVNQIQTTRPHRTIDSQLETTVYPLHVQGASTTATAAVNQVVAPEETTASSASLLPTKQVVQLAGQSYDVVVHSSVFLSFLFNLLFCLIEANNVPF